MRNVNVFHTDGHGRTMITSFCFVATARRFVREEGFTAYKIMVGGHHIETCGVLP